MVANKRNFMRIKSLAHKTKVCALAYGRTGKHNNLLRTGFNFCHKSRVENLVRNFITPWDGKVLGYRMGTVGRDDASNYVESDPTIRRWILIKKSPSARPIH